ncbi:TonB-dependent receptor plug domain-containing protein [Paraglaciecola hydrolytica]|uniref:TonB-dependent receptor n=1 Tax=Paraglaciecola hydrolytica TaxID=1799789 RepID=A0A136A043_9ALTE|nr:TonB-dependent receptor plug domain-containing protein [Paraglaciecola hydrolytica]KXI28616.1 TonB-dependent receptor [Paraglaciecola hydrolytica]
MNSQPSLKKIALAVSMAILATSNAALAQEQDDKVLDEVVTTGSRLQGSASAVIEERKNQAFVADILGAEQLSRTGDSDAASALRRVTGLTLVDGKFIYVRGLGERYSSARLNGAAIPSPDLTRNVLPLDIIPSSIIESLAVQKAYSPSMPAAFGGGSIDIRTKTVPAEFTAGIELGAGFDTSARDGNTYNRESSSIPQGLQDAIVLYRGDFSTGKIITKNNLVDSETATRSQQAIAINNQLLESLPRNFALQEESLDPAYNVKAHIGNSIDEEWLGGTLGFLLSASYDNSWDAADKRTAVIAQNIDENCATELNTLEDAAASCFNTVKDSTTTTQNERYNGVLNVGYKLGAHQVSYTNLYLADNEDESEVSLLQAPAGSTVYTIVSTGRANRSHEFNYEERVLKVSQFVGKHTFLDYAGLGADWQYTRSHASTDIPTNVEFKFRDDYQAGQLFSSSITGDDNRVLFSYTNMDDRVNSYGGNLSLPLTLGDFDLEFKAGYDFSDRARTYNTSSFAVNNETGSQIVINDGSQSPLTNGAYLTDAFIEGQRILVDFNEPTAPDADDYLAAQKVAAGYGMFDVFYKGTWRVSGGLRYEDFKQTSIGTSSLIFSQQDLDIYYDPTKIEAGSILADDLYPALSFTYIGGEDYQIRLGYGETIVRPDLREVVPVAYYDPLTDIRTFGRVGLQSSPIKNYDLRFERYFSNGDNYSIAAFYKDITAPIETVLRVGDEDYSATFINGESAEVYGMEFEWLHDLNYVASGFFTSGNITLSKSEAVIDEAFAGSLANATKPMTGHSEYVVNLQLNYDSENGEHSSSLVYNVFGERILAAGLVGSDDAYEQPFHSLDAVYTYYPNFNSTIKFKVKNILGEDQEVTQSEVIVRAKEVGTSFSVSYNYAF